MAKDPSPTPRKPRKQTARATSTKAATAKPTTKAAAPKPASRKPAPRPAAAQPRAGQAGDTVTERIVKPARDAAAGAAAAARDAAQTARDTLGNAASQSSTFGLKMIEHAETNAREAFNAMRAAAKSKDVTEVLKVQGEYLREQGARSVAQAREVSELIARFGRDAIAPLTGRKK